MVISGDLVWRGLDLWWCRCRMTGSMDLPAKGGFSFDLCRRNGMLEKKGLKLPGFRKTGTTIVGLVFQVWPRSLVGTLWHLGFNEFGTG